MRVGAKLSLKMIRVLLIILFGTMLLILMTLKNVSHISSSSLFLHFLTVSCHPLPKLSKAWIPPPSCPVWRAPGQSFCHSPGQGLSVLFPHPQPHALLGSSESAMPSTPARKQERCAFLWFYFVAKHHGGPWEEGDNV